MATPQLLRKLKTAANASNPFINACKRALEGVLAQPDVSVSFQSQGDGLSQEPSFVADTEELELKEDELRAWREATEPLQKVLPENTIYFIPYTLLNNTNTPSVLDAASATTLLSQINALNLALTLEMFLPQSTRRKFPMLTTQIPFIDASSLHDGAAKIASSQADERSYPSSGFGISHSQSQHSQSQSLLHSGYSQSADLTQEQKIDLLTLPLAELKSVYLRLCAGRKEKHVLYVLRRVILEICCISIITSTKARGLKTFKPKDLLDTFKVTFLKDPTLVGNALVGGENAVDGGDGGGPGGGAGVGVFANKEVQEKACKLWEKWAGDVMHRFQMPLTSQHAYTWEALTDTLLTDLLRHVLPPVLERLEVEGKRKVSVSVVVPTSTTSVTTTSNNNTRNVTTTNNTNNGSRAPANDIQAGGGGISTKSPAKSTVPPPTATSPDQPRGSVDSRFFTVNKKTGMKPAVAASKSTAAATIPKPAAMSIPSTSLSTTASSTTAPKPKPPPTTTPINVDISVDEFGPRIVNPAHKGPVVLPNTERTVIHAPGTAVHEFNMMDYVHDYGDDDAGRFGNDDPGFGNDDTGGFGNDDAGGAVNEEQEDGGTPFAVAVARFGQDPYIPAPKFGFIRVPENFRFNAPQRNAVKVVMTPSPESEKGSSYVPPKGSTLSRIKAAVVHSDRGQGRGTSVDPDSEDAEDARVEDDAGVVAGGRKGRKRKQSEEEEEYVEEPYVKKRKGGNGKAMPPPARVPPKPTTTIANPLPHAARHSSASSSTLFNPSDMAGSSTARGTGAVRPIVKHPVVMADTDSSDDDVPFRRRKPATSSKATTTTKAVPPPAKSTAKTATAAKKTSTSVTQTATTSKKTSTSVTAAPVQPKPRKAVPLPVSDELMKSSKERLSQIKEINEKNKRLYAALVGEDEEDTEATEEDSGDDNEEELRKFRERREREARGELRGPAIGDLENSRNKLEDLKKRSKEVEKLPVRRRAKNATKFKGMAISSGDEDELDDEEEEEEEEERVDVPRPRGRPPKNPKAKAKAKGSAADKRERGPRTYKYAVGGNEHGRSRWTEDEDKILLFALEATFYEGDLLRPWQKIRDQYGPEGTEGKGLAARNVMQIKDRVRAIAEKLVREGRERPDFLAWIKVSQKRLTTRK